MQTLSPWLTRDLPVTTHDFATETLGLDPETLGFGKTPCFSKPVTKPWWTRDLPLITREIKRGLNASKQHPVLVGFVAFFEIKVACGCWCFETKLLGWMAPKKCIGQSCQTLGFVWKPWVSQLTLRISRVLLVCMYIIVHIYIYTYTVYIYGQWKSQGNRLSWQFFLYLL